MNETRNVTGKNKRLMLHFVWEILRKFSSEAHPLQQKEIIELLREEYDADCSERTMHDYIRILQEAYPIVRKKVGCYYAEPQEFTDAELRMLLDVVLFSRIISRAQAEELIEKLVEKGSQSFKQRRGRFRSFWEGMPYSENEQTLANIGVIQKAIAHERKIRFCYNTYDTEFRFHPKREEPYIFSPHHFIVNQGRYYIAGVLDPHENVIHFRPDRMTEVEELTNEPAKQKRQTQEFRTTTLPEYSAQHSYMFTAKTITVRLRTKDWMMDTLMDWFGRSFEILDRRDDEIEVKLRHNELAIQFWALQYGASVEILSPDSLRESIAEIVRGMYGKYCGEKEE